jgi:hypothetical protein
MLHKYMHTVITGNRKAGDAPTLHKTQWNNFDNVYDDIGDDDDRPCKGKVVPVLN